MSGACDGGIMAHASMNRYHVANLSWDVASTVLIVSPTDDVPTLCHCCDMIVVGIDPDHVC
jgi:hypothetical protein